MSDLTHFDADGKAHMVNVGDKPVTDRVAVARGEITMQPRPWRRSPRAGSARAMSLVWRGLPGSWARNRPPA